MRGDREGRRITATLVDHIQPIRQGGNRAARDNLQALCGSCHSRKSASEGSRWQG
ncbi:MAG: HNH endonuclease [Pseudomonadota bacterium]|nr:HNH endonuclease [Pseudomonadota bacterium]